MKYPKIIFIIALINFTIITSLVFYLKNTTPVLNTSLKPIPSQVISITPKLGVLTPTPDTRCIIVIDGQKYNVTNFQDQHSGGNIFNCGTDMSSDFHNKHPASYLQIMSQFKI